MTELVNIMSATPQAVQIWGFHGECKARDVADALLVIASELAGPGHTIDIMSGTHGYCHGQIGAVERPEKKFAEQDRALARPTTRDGEPIALAVHDFNTGRLVGPDYVTAVMAKLNSELRNIVADDATKHTLLLAYCCSAGTR